ncbi:hypothetical protein N9N32_00335 [Alphaproteobacteria bacterium]|nr:hypothetical protein [Alphaproteobacteria bacterium]
MKTLTRIIVILALLPFATCTVGIIVGNGDEMIEAFNEGYQEGIEKHQYKTTNE